MLRKVMRIQLHLGSCINSNNRRARTRNKTENKLTEIEKQILTNKRVQDDALAN